jgi:hypothetical protein
MNDDLPAIRRLCVAYDIDLTSGDDASSRALDQNRGTAAFAGVCASLGLGRTLLAERGAGQVGVFPVGIDEPQVISSLVSGLFQALNGLNIQLRLAFHEGVTTLLAAGGCGGKAIVKVGQLVESKPLRAALAEHPRAHLAVLLTAQVFEDIDRWLPVEQFRRVDLGEHSRDPHDVAWILVPRPGSPITALRGATALRRRRRSPSSR